MSFEGVLRHLLDILGPKLFAEHFNEVGFERGLKEGRLEEARNFLLSILTQKLSQLSPQFIEKIQAIDDVDRLREVFFQVATLQEEAKILDLLKTL